MNTLRKVIHHASAGGRFGALALVAWTVGGGLMVLVALALVLAAGPGRVIEIQHHRRGPSPGRNWPSDPEFEELAAAVTATFSPGTPIRPNVIPVIEDELDDLRAAVSRALSPRAADGADLSDIVFRLSRMEDALAGLRVNQSRIIARMITFVCFAIGSRPAELLSERRTKHLAHGRFAVMWAAKRLTDFSQPRIAIALGGMDHTSIIHGQRRGDELRETDPDFRALTDAMLQHFTPRDEPQEKPPCLPL